MTNIITDRQREEARLQLRDSIEKQKLKTLHAKRQYIEEESLLEGLQAAYSLFFSEQKE